MPRPRASKKVEKPQRRQFTAEYKRRILAQAKACKKAGELGELLEREGLYSSHLANWRLALKNEGKAGLEPKKRGPKPGAKAAAAAATGTRGKTAAKPTSNTGLEKALAAAERRASEAEKLLDLQARLTKISKRVVNAEDAKVISIAKEAAQLVGVSRACEILGISRSTFYRRT
jgi:transposase-like protein